jgi:hypothetical protein
MAKQIRHVILHGAAFERLDKPGLLPPLAKVMPVSRRNRGRFSLAPEPKHLGPVARWASATIARAAWMHCPCPNT